MRSEQRVRQPVLARNAYQLYVLQKIGIRALSTFALSLFQASRFRRSTYKTTKKKEILLLSSPIRRILVDDYIDYPRGRQVEDKSNRHAQYSFWILFFIVI